MPRKPTTEFGHINFRKDGSVSKEISRLADAREEQEIARRFVVFLNDETGSKYTFRPLPEDDHDFLIMDGEAIKAVVQQIEVTRDDYTRPLSRGEYDNTRVAGCIRSSTYNTNRR